MSTKKVIPIVCGLRPGFPQVHCGGTTFTAELQQYQFSNCCWVVLVCATCGGNKNISIGEVPPESAWGEQLAAAEVSK